MMQEWIMQRMRNIVLASSSPRRRKLLESIGLKFTVDPPGIEEDMHQDVSPRGLVKRLAMQKALAVVLRHDDAIVIAADTVVVLGAKAWSKPQSKREARAMLVALSGKVHDVWTGLCLIDAKTGKRHMRAERARVWMRALTPKEIRAYIATGEPLDAAGAYQLQGRGYALTARIEGDINTIVGLPLATLLRDLRRFRVNP